jgi:3-hydroxybutyryl-CoA dehydratase
VTTYLEDVAEGLRIETERRVVTAADIDAFVDLSGDRNPLHTDDAYARDTGFAGRIAHGLLVLAIESGLSSEADEWAMGTYLEETRRFVEPVLPGDEIHSVSEVTGVRRSSSKPDRGIVTLRVETRNQRGELVLDGTDVIMVGARSGA